MPGTMKVHLYQVVPYERTQPLEDTLSEIESVSLEDRLRLVGDQEVRMEKVYPPGHAQNPSNYWLMDFSRLRFDNGPGRVSRTDPITGFNLQADEGFGEETAALYDPARGYLALQYNHFGVRSGTIKQYFSNFNGADVRVYELYPKMDESSEIRLAQKQVLKKLNFKIATASITRGQRNSGVSLERALELSDHLRGETIEVTVSAGRGANAALSHGRAMSTIRQIQRLFSYGEFHDQAVTKLEVVGKATPDSASEAIDMLTPKLEANIDGLILGLTDRRYTLESRFNALMRARAGWNDIIST